MKDKIKNTSSNQRNLSNNNNQVNFEITWENVSQTAFVILLFYISIWPYTVEGSNLLTVIYFLSFIIVSFILYYFREFLLQLKLKGQRLFNGIFLKDNENQIFYAKDDIIYYSLLLLILILAVILRFANFTAIDPYTDEYFHLIAAKELVNEGATNYTRAKLVTYLVSIFYEIGGAFNFNEYVYWSRIPGIIFGSLTVLPLYYLAQMISKPIALISALLWATSPWAIGVSRNVREYAFYPLILLIIVILLIKLLELLINYKNNDLLKIIIYSIAVISFAIYAIFFDPLSTLKVSLIPIFGVVFYYLITHINELPKLYMKNKVAAITLIALLLSTVVLILLYGYSSGQVTYVNIDYSPLWVGYYFFPEILGAPMHWWGHNALPLIAVIIFLPGLVYGTKTKEYPYFQFFIVFFTMIIGFTYFFDGVPKARFIFYALPFFIILISFGIFALIGYIKNLSSHHLLKIMGSIVIIIFVLQAFVLHNPMHRVVQDQLGHVKTTSQFHYPLDSTKDFLKKELTEEYTFITTWQARGLLYLEFDIHPDDVYIYWWKEDDKFDMVQSIVESNEQGLMILDTYRNGIWAEGYPQEESFYIGNTYIEVLHNKDGMTVYRW